jgi:hypothetical protein
VSIIRVGLAETKNFSDGYDLIFGKKDEPKKDEKKQEEVEPQRHGGTEKKEAK